MARQKVVMSSLFCSECDFEMIIPRKRGNMREKGHVKHMYCPSCEVETGFIESYEDSSMSAWDKWHESFAEKS